MNKLSNNKNKQSKEEQNNDTMFQIKGKTHTSGVRDSLGDTLEQDDNEIAVIASIKLSDQMGKYNNLVQEGNTSCRTFFFFNIFKFTLKNLFYIQIYMVKTW